MIEKELPSWKSPRFFYLIRHEDTEDPYHLGDNISVYPLGSMPYENNEYLNERILKFCSSRGWIDPKSKQKDKERQRKENIEKHRSRNRCALLVLNLKDPELEEKIFEDILSTNRDNVSQILERLVKDFLNLSTIVRRRPLGIEAVGYFNPYSNPKEFKIIITETDSFQYRTSGMDPHSFREWANRHPNLKDVLGGLSGELELLCLSYRTLDLRIKFFLRFCALESVAKKHWKSRVREGDDPTPEQKVACLIEENKITARSNYLDKLLMETNSNPQDISKGVTIAGIFYSIRNPAHHIGELMIGQKTRKKLEKSSLFDQQKIIMESAPLVARILEEYLLKHFEISSEG
ncbi:hypothetical protein JW721_01645 [Candidatus Micrarchaeota archaeon]|nr:hypothetical protein [Candidatus Micrarchaeota archaeon]